LKRKLALLNVALLALIALTGWRIWVVRDEAKAREEAVLGRTPAPVSVPPTPGISPVGPSSAASFFDIADKFLFSPDRNPTVVIEAVPEKPLPALPVAHGILDFGGEPTVILTLPKEDRQGGYRVGDKVGEFTLVEITPQDLAFQWSEGVVRRTLDQLRPQESEERRPSVRASRGGPPPPVVPEQTKPITPAATAAKGPSKIDMGGGIMACQPGDSSPAGTVVGNHRKVVSNSPFGQVCRWEPVQ
jgi:hypothetical protein